MSGDPSHSLRAFGLRPELFGLPGWGRIALARDRRYAGTATYLGGRRSPLIKSAARIPLP
jgi:hypothetical protein